jgi:chemotaxis protein histidine kinase CheA
VTFKCRENRPQGRFSRLATVRQLAVSVLAVTLGTAAAFGLVSCGGEDDAKLLPGGTATEITENLDRVKQYAEEEECVGAEDAVSEVNTQVSALADVDPKLKEALERGAARLSEVIATCDEEEASETVAPANEAPPTEETEKVPPGQEKKEEKEREKEEKEIEKEEKKAEKQEPPTTETTPEEPPSSPTQPPSEGGGTGAPGGVSPATPAEPGGE